MCINVRVYWCVCLGAIVFVYMCVHVRVFCGVGMIVLGGVYVSVCEGECE